MATARVLIVDDEPLLLKFLTRSLRENGYDAIPADGPRQAIEIIRSQPPVDIVLSDLDGPDMRGPALVNEVARVSPQAACIFMTAGGVDPADLPPDLPLLQKPFPLLDLFAAIDEVLAYSAELKARLDASIQRSAELRQNARQLVSDCKNVVQETKEGIERSRMLTRQPGATSPASSPRRRDTDPQKT